MKRSTSNSKKYIVRAIYRPANGFPQIMEFESMEEIYKKLGSTPLTLTEVGDKLFAISRANAMANREPINISTSGEIDGEPVTVFICGDVVVVGFDPETEIFKSLTEEQIEGIFFTADDIA